MFEFEPGLFIWTTVSFGLLVVLLYRVALPPLLGFLAQREKMIADALAEASAGQKKAEILLAEHRKKLAETNAAAGKMIEEAKLEGEKMRHEIIQRADQQAGIILERSRQDLAREKDSILSEARREIASLSTAVAGKIMRRTITAEDNRKIIEESLKEAGACEK